MEIVKTIVISAGVIFYGSYFVKSLLLRRNGITTNRMGQGDKPARTRRTEILLLWATVAMAVMQIFGVFIIPSFNAPLFLRQAGAAVSVVGTAFFTAAVISMKNSWRAGIDISSKTNLCTGGVMRISRNPAFLGFDLFYTGVTLAFPNPYIIVLTIICLILFHLQILEEEKFLAERFPESYTAYKSRVRRYI